MTVDSPEELYGLPLPRFIPERDALVRDLRNEKRREEAAVVAGMRKPSVAAWAVNQLVRTQSEAIRALFEAGDDLALAQSGAASGEQTADALRAASQRQRDALDDLLRTAEGLLSSDGHTLTAPTVERVRDTLRAASIDGASRRQVADGCLPQELQFAGIGIGGPGALPLESPLPLATKPSKTQRPAATRRSSAREGRAETDDAARRQAEAERESEAQRKAETVREAEAEAARRRKATLKAARQTEAEAQRAATRAEKELAAAQTRRSEAAATLEEAEELLAAAATRAEEAAAELEKARRSLSALDGA